MKYFLVFVFMISSLNGSVIESTILSVDNEKNIATIKVDKIDVGMSGFVSHKLSKEHSSILKNAVVKEFDKTSGIATLELSEYKDLTNEALPSVNWNIKVGDVAVLAYGYSRALLIAPNEEIYNKITKSTKTIQWLHPYIFVTFLSMNGHPTPTDEDFNKMRLTSNIGLIFVFLDKRLYTLDASSFKILNISDISLEQKSEKLPFYSRIDNIDANWFGEGSDELEDYEPYYYSLMKKYNPKHEKFQEILKELKMEDMK